MSFAVVDFECFPNKIIKELAIYMDGYCFNHCFLPPTAKIPTNVKKQITWITQKLHYIEWTAGNIPYDQLQCVLQYYLCNSVERRIEVFTKGEEKCAILTELLNGVVRVTNLEQLGCPKFDTISELGLSCGYFPFRHQKTTHCAERKARAFGLWLNNHIN